MRQVQWQSFGTCPVKKWIFSARDIKSMVFFNCNYISFQDLQSYFEFLVSVVNHYHINGLHLFWDSFEWFCLQINRRKIFFCYCPRHCDQGLIVVIVYYFWIWNKQEHNIIISRVICSQMGPIYIEIPYIYIYIYILIETSWSVCLSV